MNEIEQMGIKELVEKKDKLENQILIKSCELLAMCLSASHKYTEGKGKTRRYFVKKYAENLIEILDEVKDTASDKMIVEATKLLLEAKKL